MVRRAADDPLVRALAAHATVHHHDGSTGGLARAVASAAPDVVFHLASRFVARHQSDDVEPLVRDNLLFGAQLLDAMRAAAATRLVNTGSAWQHYGNRDYSPVCLYAATKQAFADLLAYFVEAHGVRAITLELTDTYGARDPRRKLIPLMLDAERDGRVMSMVQGDLPLDVVHVDDAVGAFVVAAGRLLEPGAAAHDVFAVRSGAPIAVRDLFTVWERARGTPIAAQWGARSQRAREVLDPWTQGVVLPGWSPRVSLEQGLAGL